MQARPTFLGISLKMYLGHEQTREWTTAVVAAVRDDAHVAAGNTTVAILPTFLSLESTLALAGDSGVRVGAQDTYWEDSGAFTGEISPRTLAEMGCRYVEIGHAERRAQFGETDRSIALKVAAAARNGLIPLLCVGEEKHGTVAEAAAVALAQIRSALSALTEVLPEIVIAYEPVWAIGAAQPAEPEYVRAVCREIRAVADVSQLVSKSTIIYGGSAGPGLLGTLGADVDGLFLGRFAHDPESFRRILAEAASGNDPAMISR